MKKLILIFLLVLMGCEARIDANVWPTAEAVCKPFGEAKTATYRTYTIGSNVLKVECSGNYYIEVLVPK